MTGNAGDGHKAPAPARRRRAFRRARRGGLTMPGRPVARRTQRTCLMHQTLLRHTVFQCHPSIIPRDSAMSQKDGRQNAIPNLARHLTARCCQSSQLCILSKYRLKIPLEYCHLLAWKLSYDYLDSRDTHPMSLGRSKRNTEIHLLLIFDPSNRQPNHPSRQLGQYSSQMSLLLRL